MKNGSKIHVRKKTEVPGDKLHALSEPGDNELEALYDLFDDIDNPLKRRGPRRAHARVRRRLPFLPGDETCPNARSITRTVCTHADYRPEKNDAGVGFAVLVANSFKRLQEFRICLRAYGSRSARAFFVYVPGCEPWVKTEAEVFRMAAKEPLQETIARIIEDYAFNEERP